MGDSVTLEFYKRREHFSYRSAEKQNAVYAVELTYGEAHKGLGQTAVFDAIEIVNMVKTCFGIEEPLSFVLTQDGTIIDCG